jgi:hypothetical protein
MVELFRASRDSLGSRTLAESLREKGFKIGRDRTRRIFGTFRPLGGLMPLVSNSGCGKLLVRWCGRGDGVSPVTLNRSRFSTSEIS